MQGMEVHVNIKKASESRRPSNSQSSHGAGKSSYSHHLEWKTYSIMGLSIEYPEDIGSTVGQNYL